MKYIFIITGFMIGTIVGTIIEHYNQSCPRLKEYQLRLELDSTYIYEHGRFVGSCPHGKDGIDSVLLNDNL